MFLFRFVWTSCLKPGYFTFLCKYKKVTYSDVCIQSTFSDYCGKFCIAFIKNVHSRHSYDDFIDQFDFVNLYKNDSIVENIYL